MVYKKHYSNWKFLRCWKQRFIGGKLAILGVTSPIGIALLGIVEGGINIIFRRQGKYRT